MSLYYITDIYPETHYNFKTKEKTPVWRVSIRFKTDFFCKRNPEIKSGYIKCLSVYDNTNNVNIGDIQFNKNEIDKYSDNREIINIDTAIWSNLIN